ncbi:unnamed protein product [Thlaspi arvense]|uniref:LAZY1 n=1 Tax=Thlaspi arvense TaxID=13288 RepID=A0AAU9RKI4_THLAR|nr:unnamed protein product [Thlaspi arvense]
MKLLSWMRTIKQPGVDPSKEFKGDFCCLRAQVSSEVQDIRTNSFSFSFSGPSHDKNQPELDEELRFDEDGFSGFLAIGTLGRDPETPKFAASVKEEDVTGAQKEMAKLITEKLDKFLEDYPEDTSSKRVESSNAEGDRESDVCSLQGYDLFRSTIEFTKRSNKVQKNKGLLTSLFKRGKTSVQIFRSKVHPVLYTRADTNIDDRRRCITRCDLRVPSLDGSFLASSSISEANKTRENWINTDAEYLVLEL